jgi:hypothetical protein
MDQLLGVNLIVGSPLTIMSLARDWIGVRDARPPSHLCIIASAFSLDD